MDLTDFGGLDPHGCSSHHLADLSRHELMGHDHCGLDPNQQLHEQLTVAYVAQGMDPLEAAMQTQLQAPLIKPFLS